MIFYLWLLGGLEKADQRMLCHIPLNRVCLQRAQGCVEVFRAGRYCGSCFCSVFWTFHLGWPIGAGQHVHRKLLFLLWHTFAAPQGFTV